MAENAATATAAPEYRELHRAPPSPSPPPPLPPLPPAISPPTIAVIDDPAGGGPRGGGGLAPGARRPFTSLPPPPPAGGGPRGGGGLTPGARRPFTSLPPLPPLPLRPSPRALASSRCSPLAAPSLLFCRLGVRGGGVCAISSLAQAARLIVSLPLTVPLPLPDLNAVSKSKSSSPGSSSFTPVRLVVMVIDMLRLTEDEYGLHGESVQDCWRECDML